MIATYPPDDAVRAFGLPPGGAVALPGVQRRAFRIGTAVMKYLGPDAHEPTTRWWAELIGGLPRTDFRTPRLIPTCSGHWIWHGWIAMEWLTGISCQGHWSAKVNASQAFHAAIVDAVPPTWFEPGNGPWAIADRAAWDEESVEVDARVKPLAEPLLRRRSAIPTASQLVHGDLSRGNILLDPGRPPAILDFAPYIRPNGLPLAVMAVDEIAWHGEEVTVIDQVPAIDHWDQLLLRAALMRLIGLQELAKVHPRWDWLRDAAALRTVVQEVAHRLDVRGRHQ